MFAGLVPLVFLISLSGLSVVCKGWSYNTEDWFESTTSSTTDQNKPAFGYMLSMERDYSQFCGAAIISKTWAVTSAKCVNESPTIVRYPLEDNKYTRIAELEKKLQHSFLLQDFGKQTTCTAALESEKLLFLEWAPNGVLKESSSATLLIPKIYKAETGTYIDDIRLRAGGRWGEKHYIKQVFVHPKYNPETLDYDIAVIQVSREFQYSDEVRAISLAREKLSEGTTAVLSGWSSGEYETTWDYNTGPTVVELRPTELPIMYHHDCYQYFSKFHEKQVTLRMVCTAPSEYSRDYCGVKIGSPLVVNDELAGIVSWSVECGKAPGVHTDVTYLRDWISAVTGVN